MAAVRRRPGGVQAGRVLRRPRGAGARLRAGPDPDRLAHRQPYDVSGHFVWVGERTRQLDGAHIDFAARVRNPIGVKLGPTTTPGGGSSSSSGSTPSASPGRLTFITRMGAGSDPRRAARRSSRRSRRAGARSCGSATRCTATRSRPRAATRRVASTTSSTRCSASSRCTAALGTVPGGIHVELTGDDVTECVGGAEGVDEDELASRYETACDPRLNRVQSLELAFDVADWLLDRPRRA